MYTILIADDERNERTGIEKLLRHFQYDLKIVQAANGREALAVFEHSHIDILLTDIKMPFLGGIDLIKQVHKGGWDPICIIYSAYGEFEYAQNAIALGVVQYLLKPIKRGEFQELFDKVLSMCEEKARHLKEREELKRKLKSAENDRLYRQLLRYLDSDETVQEAESDGSRQEEESDGSRQEAESDENRQQVESDESVQEVESLFEEGSLVPLVLCSYSWLFSKYWESYEADIYKIFGSGAAVINKDDSQTLILAKAELLATSRKAGEVCDRLIDMSRGKYQSELFIVAGDKCRNISELKVQYEKIREQLDYQFFVSESTYFLSDEGSFVKKESDMLDIYFKKILTCARLGDFGGIKGEFAKAFEYVEKNMGFSSIYIKYNFSEVIKKCCELLHSQERLMKVVEDIYGSHSIVQVKEAVLHLIDSLADADRSRQDNNRLVSLAKVWIHDHYQDCSLSVSSIADELSISSAYLSTQFKAETGQQLVKYISKYRIERAKELLTTTNMKVGDVAKKVGYLNTSYFISLFKNHVGSSPVKYRERAFQDE